MAKIWDFQEVILQTNISPFLMTQVSFPSNLSEKYFEVFKRRFFLCSALQNFVVNLFLQVFVAIAQAVQRQV